MKVDPEMVAYMKELDDELGGAEAAAHSALFIKQRTKFERVTQVNAATRRVVCQVMKQGVDVH